LMSIVLQLTYKVRGGNSRERDESDVSDFRFLEWRVHDMRQERHVID
jgi:hypothetical protein